MAVDPVPIVIVPITGTHTLAVGDLDKMLRATAACDVSIPTDATAAWPQGWYCTVHADEGAVEVTAPGGGPLGTVPLGHTAALINVDGVDDWLLSVEQAGPAGPPGADGADGADGATGPAGPAGPTGATGPQGPQGDPGADGADGVDGADGASAYEVAVAGGFVGDEAAWLASLVGADGADGATGATGPAGPAGPQGDPGPTGATGPAGPQGPQGDPGADGADGSDATVTTANVKAALVNQSLEDMGAIEHNVNVVAASGASQTLDAATHTVHRVVLSANCTFTFSNPAPSGHFSQIRLVVVQDGTGGRTVTLPGSVDWTGGTPPTLVTTANAVNVLDFFTTDGGTIWHGVAISLGSA